MLTFLALLVGLAVGGYLLAIGALYVFQRRLLYAPDTSTPAITDSGLAGITEVKVETADGLRLSAWYCKPRPAMATVLYFHGNAGNIGSRTAKIAPFLDAGYGLLLVGYRGFGGNAGSPSEPGLYADARGAVQYLKKQAVLAADLIVYGESLGTAVAVRMAVELADGGGGVRALVLEAPFTSVVEAASRFYPVFPISRLLKDHFDSAAIIERVGAPVFIVHGEKDTTMPIEFGKKLYRLAVSPKQSLWVAEAGHGDLFDYGVAGAVLEFIAGQARNGNMVNNS